MPLFEVVVPCACSVTVQVNAENEEEAKDIAISEIDVQSYCGNGGYDKLIGVESQNQSIEFGDIDYDKHFDITEVED